MRGQNLAFGLYAAASLVSIEARPVYDFSAWVSMTGVTLRQNAGVVRMESSGMQPIIAGIAQKLSTLPRERLAEVQDFVDFVAEREVQRQLVSAAARLS